MVTDHSWGVSGANMLKSEVPTPAPTPALTPSPTPAPTTVPISKLLFPHVKNYTSWPTDTVPIPDSNMFRLIFLELVEVLGQKPVIFKDFGSWEMLLRSLKMDPRVKMSNR